MSEQRSERLAGEINDEVGRFEGFAAERFGRELGDGVIVGEKSLFREAREGAEGIKAGAGGFDDVGGEFAGNGFGHRTATSVAETDE